MAMEATEYAFPFDAEECEGGYDREYIADDFARYFRAFITSGIIADGGNIAESLQVVANDDMTTTLKKGNLIIDGYRYELSEDMIFHHTAADGVLDRIDRISVTLDTAGREIHAIVKEGEYSYNPLAPECRRNSEHLDYVVADVRVVAGAIKIAQANITDTRLSTELCGVAHPFWKLDTQAFFVQLNSFYNEFVAKSDRSYKQFQDWQDNKKTEIEAWKKAEEVQTDNWQKNKTDNFEEWADGFISTWEGWMSGKVGDWTNEILDWFNNLREQLTDNAEVRLQEQIGNLNDLQTEEKSSLVEAINAMGDRITSAVTTLKDGISKAVKKSGDTMTGTLNSSKKTQTYLAGNKGDAIINSTAPAGEYVMLDKLNSQNGYFTDGVWGTRREFHYTSKANVDANTNAVEKTVVLLDEAGNSSFPGTLTAPQFAGKATSAEKLSTEKSINGLIFNGTADRMNYAVCDNIVIDNGFNYTINVACPGFKLVTGAEIRVIIRGMEVTGWSTTSGIYLNVNNTGRIKTDIEDYRFIEDKIYTFIYDGSKWKLRSIDKIWLSMSSTWIDAWDGAVNLFIPIKFGARYLLIGSGWSSSASSSGVDDYFKVSLLTEKTSGTNASWSRVWQEITIGSSGSTARFSFAKENDTEGITFKVPKGSAGGFLIYGIK